MVEEWKDIPQYEGLYQASNLGRVKTFPRKGSSHKEMILKPFENHNGYLEITLWKHNKNKLWKSEGLS
jgi:hypothetical protein